MSDPIDRTEWVDANTLKANHWNPNVVFNAELELLEHSILEDGWTQAILINSGLIIIDGFHRWRLSLDSPDLLREYGGLVPVIKLDISEPEAMLRTVRINRAKGKHVAVRMSGLVQSLVDEWGYTEAQIMKGIGATRSEVQLLLAGNLLKSRNLDKVKYSEAWVPIETKLEEAEEEEYEREDDPVAG